VNAAAARAGEAAPCTTHRPSASAARPDVGPWARVAVLVGAVTVVVASSALVWPVAPGYDAWAWLTWGREVGRLELSTVDGPAWKPLPVAITALLAPLGDAAPESFVLLVRAGAVAAVGLAFVAGRRLAGPAAGLLAAVSVGLTGGFARHAAVGDTEPLLVAFALVAFLFALEDRHRAALACGVLCALLRPETWPFLGLYGLWRWRADPALRPGLALLAIAVPALWLVPEWLGSGELLRSGERARIPNPGQPATAEHPGWATLRGALDVLFLPAAALALAARGPARVLAGAGATWIVLVALMSEAGFSGEGRYLLAGAALLAVAAGAGAARVARGRGRGVLAALVAVVAVAGVPRLVDLAELRPRLTHQAALVAGLDRALAAAGGRGAVLACGRPAVGRYRGTLLAWRLDVPKRAVRADGAPDAVTFRSRLTPGGPVSPPAPDGAHQLARSTTWSVMARCPGSGTARRAPPSRAGRR
jgi:hypothetical protein